MSEAAAAAGFSRLLSDERLTRRAVGGDERAFAAIFRRYHQGLYRFCLAIVGNPEDAQDALQNTMIKVLRALPGEEREIELKPWLYRIAHNESIDLLRRRRETRELDVEQIAPGYGLAEDAAARERLRQLIADMKELPERQRQVLVMRELGGLDFDEIGMALSTSGAVARQTLYEARQSLRQMEAGREMGCDEVMRALSDGDGRVTRRRDVRAHVRACANCSAFRDEIKGRQHDLAALSPLPALAAAGMLQGLIGGSQGAAGGGLAATLGGGAAKTIGASAAAKGAATAAVVAAIGVTAADQTGVIHLGLPGERPAGRAAAPVPGSGSQGRGAAAGSPQAAGAGGERADAKAAAVGQAKRVRAGEASAVQQAAPQGRAALGPGHSHARHQPHGDAGSEVPAAADHPHGQGHEKQHPAAATDGEENAASHKAPPREPSTEPEGSDVEEGGGQAVTPTKPSHPTPPATTPSGPPGEVPANPPQAAPAPAPSQAAEDTPAPPSRGSSGASENAQGGRAG